jgi:alkylhydroperoxidase/carboxymuconolactone decarboxylase family protein YurZ
MADVNADTAGNLRGLAVGDSSVLEGLIGAQVENLEASGLDPRAYSLVKIATLVALDAPPASYVAQVAFALEAGVTPEEAVGVLIAVAPQVGLPKIVAAAPELMLALGLAVDDDGGQS